MARHAPATLFSCFLPLLLYEQRVILMITGASAFLKKLYSSISFTAGDVIFGDKTNNTITGTSGNNTIYGGAGDDVIYGGAGSDVIYGGEGNDIIHAMNASPSYTTDDDLYDYQDTSLFPVETVSNYLDGGSGNDSLYGSSGADFLQGASGNDYLEGGEGSDVLYGGSGDDILVADKPAPVSMGSLAYWDLTDASSYQTEDVGNYLNGGDGNDTLFGSSGDDTLIGGSGNDTFKTNWGADTYIFAANSGQDVIEAQSTSLLFDTLDFTSVTSDQLWFSEDSSGTLTISVIGTNNTVSIANYNDLVDSSDPSSALTIKTADGKTLNGADGLSNLVQAMSSMSAPAAGQTTLSTTYETSLATVLAANWK
jgi:Ca2+-binding RTX toxin-like protein